MSFANVGHRPPPDADHICAGYARFWLLTPPDVPDYCTRLPENGRSVRPQRPTTSSGFMPPVYTDEESSEASSHARIVSPRQFTRPRMIRKGQIILVYEYSSLFQIRTSILRKAPKIPGRVRVKNKKICMTRIQAVPDLITTVVRSSTYRYKFDC